MSMASIIQDAIAGRSPGKAECVQLLALPEESPEAQRLREAGRLVSRRRFGDKAVLKAQIGIDVHPCGGGCLFCGFGDGVTEVESRRMPVDEIVERAVALAGEGELHALSLMTMHDVDLPSLREAARAVRAAIPACTQVVVNIGDVDAEGIAALANAGVGGAYHVRRLGEGEDTAIDPARREESIRAFRAAGLDWYTCCEPIGPEHAPEELAEQIFLGIEHGCYHHAAMRRVALPATPIAARGVVSETRLAQIVSVIALATQNATGMTAISVHEPNLVSLLSGANGLSAESGANPRDLARDTEEGRGWSVARCKALLHEAGYRQLLRIDGSCVPLERE